MREGILKVFGQSSWNYGARQDWVGSVCGEMISGLALTTLRFSDRGLWHLEVREIRKKQQRLRRNS